MRTDLGNGLVVDTNGYDAVAEIESTGDKYGTAKYIRERKKECEEQARKYLEEHPKTTYYIASGYPTMMAHDDDVPDSDYRSLIAYTEEEIKRIKELIVEVWNNEDLNSPIQSVDDIDDFMLERMTSGRVCDIDAKAVLKLFEAKDYVDLLERIKERFHEETAYDDLVTYLRENKLVE